MPRTVKMTFEDYLQLDAEDWIRLGLPESRCEFVDGEVVELPPESGINYKIANYLFLLLVQAGIRFDLIYPHTCEVEVPVVQPKDARTRFPDLVVLRPEHLPLVERRLTVTRDMPPPRLAVEVVSPGKPNPQRDYDRKRAQYEQRGIEEFWLIDPSLRCVTVLHLQGDRYEEVGQFQGTQTITSIALAEFNLQLTADQLFQIEM